MSRPRTSQDDCRRLIMAKGLSGNIYPSGHAPAGSPGEYYVCGYSVIIEGEWTRYRTIEEAMAYIRELQYCLGCYRKLAGDEYESYGNYCAACIDDEWNWKV
jgi:hypothetical protein